MTQVEALDDRRLFSAGGPDPAYGGGDGSVDVRINAHAWAPNATGAAVDDAGRAIVAGVYGGKAKNQFSVARLTAGGEIDATFGANGIAAAPLPLARSGDVELAVDGRGRVLVMISTDRGATVTRLTERGVPDRKFGKNGTAVVPIVTSAADLAVDAANDVVVIGTTPGKSGTRAAVVRLTYRGKPDATFGGGGVYKAPVPAGRSGKSNGSGQTVHVLPDGRMSCVAFSDYGEDESAGVFYDGFAAFQLDAAGRLRTGFGTDGFLRDGGYSDTETRRSVRVAAIAADGRFVVTTEYYDDGGNGRLHWEGSYDLYDADGQPTSAAFGYDYADRGYYAADVVGFQADGKVIVDDATDVFRLNADLTPDGTFDATDAAFGLLGRPTGVRLVRGSDTLLLVAPTGRVREGSVFAVTAVALA